MPRPKPPASARLPRKSAISPNKNLGGGRPKPSSSSQQLSRQRKKNDSDLHDERNEDQDDYISDAADEVYDSRRNEENSGRHYGSIVHEENFESSQSKRGHKEKPREQSRSGLFSENVAPQKRVPRHDDRENYNTDEEKEEGSYTDDFERIEEKVSESISVTVNERLTEFEERIMRVVHDALGSANKANSTSQVVKANRMSHNFTVTNTQKILIGNFVRNKMFRIIKFLEEKTLASKGNDIIEKSKQAAGITEPTTPEMNQVIMQRVRDHHNRHKGHVRKKIRDLATGESIAYCFCLGMSKASDIFSNKLVF